MGKNCDGLYATRSARNTRSIQETVPSWTEAHRIHKCIYTQTTNISSISLLFTGYVILRDCILLFFSILWMFIQHFKHMCMCPVGKCEECMQRESFKYFKSREAWYERNKRTSDSAQATSIKESTLVTIRGNAV